MTVIPQDSIKSTLSIEARLFAEKAARSVAEIQSDIVNVFDVVTFLEILGYDDKEVRNHGFSDLLALSNYIVSFVDNYEDANRKTNVARSSTTAGIPVPSVKSRLIEAVAVQAPWLGALVVLNLTGISLWMARGLPSAIATLFVAGIYAGLILSEGLLQMFSRLLFMHYDQNNPAEVRRIILRSYLSTGVLVGVTALAAIVLFTIAFVPTSYALLFIVAAASVAVHRMSFNLLYTLKMVKNIVAAYACGFVLLLSIYYFLPLDSGTGPANRYFISLGVAFAAISGFSVYSHVVALRKISKPAAKDLLADRISFYKSQSTIRNSLKSRFSIQAIESIPQFISGLFFFVMLFGDRILAWIFNPHRLVIANNQFPIAFNSEYHIGADVSLLVLVPAAILQYVLISPLYALVQNKAMDIRLRDLKELDSLIARQYRKSMLAILVVVGLTVIGLNLLGPNLISMLKGTNASLTVLRLTSVGNLAVAVLTTNLVFLTYFNRTRLSSKLIVLASALTLTLGAIFALFGVANIGYGYLISSAAVAALSTYYTRHSIKNEFVRTLSRFS